MEHSANEENHFYGDDLCSHCRNSVAETGYSNLFCKDCRHSLSKYPLPRWIKLFGLGLLLIMGLSFYRTKDYLDAAIHMGRGEKAIEQKNYGTAQKEIEKVLKYFPHNKKVNGFMMIAASYNEDSEAASSAFNWISEQSFEDDAFLSNINNAIDYIYEFKNLDSIAISQVDKLNDSVNLITLSHVYDTTSDAGMKIYITNRLSDIGALHSTDSILQTVIHIHPDSYTALIHLAAIQRLEGKFGEALISCDQILKSNQQNVYALSQKARIGLRMKNYSDALKYSAAAMSILPNNDYVLETRTMVDHMTGNEADCIKNLTTLKKHAKENKDSFILNRVIPIINDSTSFQ